MAKDFGDKQPDFSRLLISLNQAQLEKKNPALFQVLNELIGRTAQSRNLIIIDIDDLEEEIKKIKEKLNAQFLTWDDNVDLLPNSRNLLAGIGITFDDTVDGVRTISSSGGGGFIPMATGAEPLDFMSNGAGEPLLIAFSTDQPV